MPWLRFLRRYHWSPAAARSVTFVYKAGRHYLVTTPCAEAALRAGAAIRERPDGRRRSS